MCVGKLFIVQPHQSTGLWAVIPIFYSHTLGQQLHLFHTGILLANNNLHFLLAYSWITIKSMYNLYPLEWQLSRSSPTRIPPGWMTSISFSQPTTIILAWHSHSRACFCGLFYFILVFYWWSVGFYPQLCAAIAWGTEQWWEYQT